jgi:hypothetical protein
MLSWRKDKSFDQPHVVVELRSCLSVERKSHGEGGGGEVYKHLRGWAR